MSAGDWNTDKDFNCLHGSSWYEKEYTLPNENVECLKNQIIALQSRLAKFEHNENRYEELRVKYVDCLRKLAALEEENYNLRLDRHMLTETEREWS